MKTQSASCRSTVCSVSLALFAMVAFANTLQAADPVTEAATGLRGLCVHLGAGDGQRTIAIAKAGNAVVHAFAADAGPAAAAVRDAGLDERVTVESWSLPRLPYSDHSADLVVAEADCGIAESEIRRILVPGGRALLADANGWRTVRGDPARGADNWTHSRHGADANPVSRDTALENVTKALPDRLRWINDVSQIWPHAFRIADGRVFFFRMVQEANDGRVLLEKPSAAQVRCRSAWNGIMLWEGTYPDVAPSNGQNRPIATPTRVYLHNKYILALDAATGKEVARAAVSPFDLIAPDDGLAGVIVARTSNTVFGLDAGTLEERWRVNAALPDAATAKVVRGKARASNTTTVVSDGKRAYTIEQVRTNLHVLTIGLKDGATNTLGGSLNLGMDAYPMLVSEGVLVVAGKGYAAGIPTDGKDEAWRQAIGTFSTDKTGKVTRADADVPALAMTCSLAQGGRLWFRDELNMIFGTGEISTNPPALVGWTSLDLHTGAVGKQIGYPTARPWGGIDLPSGPTAPFVKTLSRPTGRNWSPRCYADIAFPCAILSQTTEIVGFDGAEPLHMRGVRGQCGVGYALGANGMFTPPNQCLGCYPMIRGMIGYEPRTESGAVPIEDTARLVRGPAFGAVVVSEPKEGVRGWPMYRANAMRTGCTPEAIPTANMTELWTARTPGRSTQAVVAEGTLVVGTITSGRITALDSATGARRWEIGLAARVDTAPTIHAGMVFVGCHDGKVYAFSLADGRMVWRFTAAPMERRIVAGDRVESPWPVMGAVLVHDGAVHVIAGHHTSVEGGLQFWGLDPATGAIRYRNTFTGIKGTDAAILPTHWYKHEESALNNVLLGGKVGETQIVRLYDEWGGWDFRAKDGTFLRQHGAVPQPGWPHGRVSPGEVTPDDRWPWVGHDRIASGRLLRGMPLTHADALEMDPRTRFSGTAGHFFLCPRQGATAMLFMVKRGKTTVDPEPWIVPTDPKVYGEPKVFAEYPERKAADTWAPVTFPLETAGAMVTAEKVLWLAGKAYVESSTNAPVAAPALSGTMVAVSIADGSQLGKWDFDGGVTFEGLSAADGRVYLAQDDGTVRCFGVKR